MLLIPVLYLVIALIVGLYGRSYRFGFWGFFFATLLFTPLVGFLLLIVAHDGRKQRAQH